MTPGQTEREWCDANPLGEYVQDTSLPEWFVYDNTCYYPDAEIVRAATAEEAARIATRDSDEGAVVFPVSAVAHVVERTDDEAHLAKPLLNEMRDAGRESERGAHVAAWLARRREANP